MTAPLVELFTQACERSTELADHVVAAEGEVEQLLKVATLFSEEALQHAEALHKDVAEAVQAVESARTAVDAEVDKTDAVLDGLPGRSDASEAKVRSLLDGIRHDAAELQGLRSRLVTRADEGAQQVASELADLERRVAELRLKMEGRLAEADAQVLELMDAVEHGQTRLAEDERGLREALQSLGVLASDQAHAFGATLNAVVVLTGRGVVAASNHVVTAHNDAFKSLRTAFTGEQPGAAAPDETWVETALQPIRGAMDEFALVPAPARQLLETAVAVLVQKARQALGDLSEAARSLEQAVPEIRGS
jgi:hypothetical protein